MQSKGFVILDWVVCILLFIAALALQIIPIDPTYLFPGKLSCDFPKRSESLPVWGFFLVVCLVPTACLFFLYDKSIKYSVGLKGFLPLVTHFLFSVSAASVLCSVVHIIMGTPRPDSAEMCNNVNVTYVQCASVLTKSQLVKQYQSFPSLEAAVSMAAAVGFARIVGMFLNGSTIWVLIRCAPLVWAIAVSPVLVATGCYRLEDVIGGSVLGFICSWCVTAGLAFDRRDIITEEKSRALEVML